MNEPTKGGRYFIVQAKQDGARCLVEANTISSALRRAAEFYCNARAAKPAEIVALMQEGCEVIEIVSGEDIELPLPQSSAEQVEAFIAQADAEGKTL